MATKKKKRRKRLSGSAKALIVVIALIVAVFSYLIYRNEQGGGYGSGSSSNHSPSDKEKNDSELEGDNVKFHFVDVGQGDCTVICTKDGNIIIDAGKTRKDSEAQMKAYIDDLGITEFKYAIFTHPHEDHIGGADVILENYKIENVIIPDYEATTKIYETMLECIDKSGAEVEVIEEGENFEFNIGDLRARILAPVKFDNNPNNASIVTRLDYGEVSVMITGDAEGTTKNDSEKLMLEKYKDDLSILDCDIYKLGHHGAKNASSKEFLEAMSPEIGIISCGVDNDYGHPHEEVLERLKDANVKYYRTDELGTIIVSVYKDGYKVSTANKK